MECNAREYLKDKSRIANMHNRFHPRIISSGSKEKIKVIVKNNFVIQVVDNRSQWKAKMYGDL